MLLMLPRTATEAGLLWWTRVVTKVYQTTCQQFRHTSMFSKIIFIILIILLKISVAIRICLRICFERFIRLRNLSSHNTVCSLRLSQLGKINNKYHYYNSQYSLVTAIPYSLHKASDWVPWMSKHAYIAQIHSEVSSCCLSFLPRFSLTQLSNQKRSY